MENQSVIQELFNYAFEALLLVITGLIIPWIKSKVGVAKFEKTALFICSAVKSAEQIYGSKSGSEKLNYVVEQLKLNGIKIDETVLSQIESAVFEQTRLPVQPLAPVQPTEVIESNTPLNS